MTSISSMKVVFGGSVVVSCRCRAGVDCYLWTLVSAAPLMHIQNPFVWAATRP